MPKSANVTPVTVTVADAAELSGLSVMTIHRKAISGELASKRVGRRRLIQRQSLMEMIGAPDAAT